MERDAENRLVASKTKFPSGIKWLADRVHKKGELPKSRAPPLGSTASIGGHLLDNESVSEGIGSRLSAKPAIEEAAMQIAQSPFVLNGC